MWLGQRISTEEAFFDAEVDHVTVYQEMRRT